MMPLHVTSPFCMISPLIPWPQHLCRYSCTTSSHTSGENPRAPDTKTPVLSMGTDGESLLVLGSAQAMTVRWDLGVWTLVLECRLLLSYMINLPGYANAALPNFSFLEACRRKTLHFFFPCFFVVLLPVCKRCCSHKQPSTCKEAPGRSLTQEWNFARQSQSN